MHGVEFKSELKQISTIRSQYNDAIYMAKNFVESIFGSEGAAKAPDSLPQRIVSPREGMCYISCRGFIFQNHLLFL